MKRILLNLIFIVGIANTVKGQEALLCRGHHWTEEEANLMLKSFASEWDDRVSWEARAKRIKRGIIQGMQLDKMPRISGNFKPIHADRKVMDGYLVENIAIESFPGFYITGNLYTPIGGKKPYAA
ncbi:MAG: acetylxylan esterase, partial [Bacteroidota bacterium]